MPLTRLSFDLSAPKEAPEVSLAAAFGILLARYNSAAAVQLRVSRVAGPELAFRDSAFLLETPADAPCRQILDQAAASLGAANPQRLVTEASADVPRGAITFLQPGVPEASDGGDEPLKLEVASDCDRVRVSLLYDEGAFTRASIERAVHHLTRLLSEVSANDGTSVARVPMVLAEEKRQIESLCDGRPRGSRAELVHTLIEGRAAATPSAAAVRFRDEALTYRDLNRGANALARCLVARGVGAECRVAVCLAPSLDLPVALLAALKAGGAYVPLDPTHPDARLRAMLDDIKPQVLITRAAFLDKFEGSRCSILLMDEAGALTANLSEDNLDVEIARGQTASIFFTSGTTGAPKGAMASHGNLAAYIAMARDRYEIGPADVIPAIARFSFSISMFELLSPLTAGGTLLVLDREHILDLEQLSNTLQGVTIFHAGPSLLKNLVAHIRRRYSSFEAFNRVRHASSGGDMVPPDLLESMKEIFARAEVFVIYGCTEISCMGCTYPVPRDRVIGRTYVGRPFDGVSVRVLDHALNLMPAGVVGEIWFAGEGVVKGYLDRPELTSERFVEIDGTRFYRTGDMGRLTEDGWIELLGRSDFQLKLRGIRVEIGEVEYWLRRAEGVRDAVVMPMTLGTEKALVAYVVLNGERPTDNVSRDSSPALEAIRQHMAQHLPEYMLPATYVELEKLPLNHNMKVDRKALPPPEAVRRTATERRVRSPRTETEKRLAALWTKVLGVDRIGLDDRYFDMGGDSLRGLEFITAVGRDMGVELKGLDLVRETLEGLAAICDSRLGIVRGATESVESDDNVDARFEVFHFGADNALYGVLFGRPRVRATDAVLICSPLGHDAARSHFILHRLAARLSAQGVPALRFDYYGCGDSMGDSAAANCDRWRRDIQDAYCELKTRVPGARITAVGVRLAASLVAEALRGADVAKFVVWDPVCDGSSYYLQAAATHERFIGKWRRLFRPPARLNGSVELVGWTLSEATIAEIRALAFPLADTEPLPPLRWLATSAPSEQRRLFETVSGRQDSRFEMLEWTQGWNDTWRIGEMLADVGVSSALAKMATEQQ